MLGRYSGGLVGVLVAISVLAATGTAVATPADGRPEAHNEERTVLVDDIDGLVAAYNGHVGQLRAIIRDRYADEPTKRTVALNGHDLLRGRLAGERIEVRVRLEDGGVQKYHARMNNTGHIVEYGRGAYSGQPTMAVTTDERTVGTITNSAKPADTALAAYRGNNVTVRPVEFDDRVVFAIADVATSVGSATGTSFDTGDDPGRTVMSAVDQLISGL